MGSTAKTITVRSGFLAAALLGLIFAGAAPTAPSPDRNWYKGNLHTHTTHSDGDSSPDFVARWYKEHDYDFLVLSDHNYFTDPKGLNTVFASPERFLLVPGEEVTSRFEDKAVHVNAYGISEVIPPAYGDSVLDTIQKNVDAILQAGGIAALNHPNFRWSITADEIRQTTGMQLFEVYNGHPQVHNNGAGGTLGLEEMWDTVLTSGRRIFAVAVDDAHNFKVFGPQYSNPGRGWVGVKSTDLSTEGLLQGIRAGEFYASTGVELEDVIRESGVIHVRIKTRADFKFTTRYTGADGKLLEESFAMESSYTLKPGEPYVRATITDSMGHKAWVQPVFSH